MHQAYYSKDELTDKNERFIVSEIVRGEIFKIFSQEIPYSTHVEINTFKNEENLLRIEGYIFTESESQKTIIIGKKGKKIRDLSKNSRLKMPQLSSFIYPTPKLSSLFQLYAHYLSINIQISLIQNINLKMPFS